MKESTTPDKYDEDGQQWAKELLETITDELAWSGGIPDSRWIEIIGAGIAMRLRSAFPPPAEDAQVLVDKIRSCKPWEQQTSDFDEYKLDRVEAAAEIESFAESRVEPWREALRKMVGYADMESWRSSSYRGTGDPDHYRIMANMGRALLSDFPAKEAAR